MASQQDDLEILLNGRSQRTVEVRELVAESTDSQIQTATANASLFDFIKMVEKLTLLTLKDLEVEFIPDENKNIVENADIKLDHPVITYKVIFRKPKTELKPRIRQTIREKAEDADEERVGEVYGQKFDCIIQFNVFASVYDVAEQVMERFEEMIFVYTGWMKNQGVAELLFDQQLTDENYDLFRQTISVRNLRYKVEVEKLHVIFTDKIKSIETLGL